MDTLTKDERIQAALESMLRLVKAGREKEVDELLSKPPTKPVDKIQTADIL